MSDSAIINGCVHHYNARHIQLRKDFFELCAYDKSDFNQGISKNGKPVKDEPSQECMAKLLRLFETLTDDDRKVWHRKAIVARSHGLQIGEEPQEFPLELTLSAICKLLYNTDGESTVRNSLAVLILRGYITRTQETKNSIPYYALLHKNLQKALDAQYAETLKVQGPISEATEEEESSGSEIDTSGSEIEGQLSEIGGSGSEIGHNNNIYKTNSNKHLKKEDTALSFESATPSLISDAALLAELQRRGLLPQAQDVPVAASSPQEDILSAVPKCAQLVDNRPVNVDNSQTNVAQEENVQGESPDPGGVTETPADVQRVGKGPIASSATKPSKRRKNKGATPTPMFFPPAKPDAAQPWNAQKCLAWADYARQVQFPVSNRRDSKYGKSQDAANAIEGLGITENTFLILYFNWMKGIDLDLNLLGPDKLKSDSWCNYSVELWIFVEHYADELRKYKQAKADQTQRSETRSVSGLRNFTHNPPTETRRSPVAVSPVADDEGYSSIVQPSGSVPAPHARRTLYKRPVSAAV